MNKWEDLTLSEKSEMMRVAVENGITNLPDIKQAYNEFAEGGDVPETQSTENIFRDGGYKPSERIKQRITHYEGKAMTGAKDPLSGKWGKNNSFESEAKNFYNALPKDIREQVLSNPDLADSLYSYSYNVGAGRFRERVVPALRNYYHGKGTVQDIENSMWASGDSKLKGLQRRRAEERKGVRSALIGDIPYLPSNTPSYPTVYDTPQFVPANPQAFYTSPTAYQPIVLPDEQQPIVREALAYDPKEIERQERQRGLNNFMTLMSMTSPQESGNPYLDTIGMLAGNQFKKGGRIYIKPKNRGKFTKLKERTGHSATWFKKHGTPAQKKMAIFALNARKWKHGLGGNLFDGTTEDSQQMSRPNIYRYNDGRYVYQAAPDAEEIEVSPINTLLPNPSQWTYQDAEGKVYTPHAAQVDTGSITQSEDTNPLLRAANNYMREAAYRAKDGTLALQGKYTMPAIAASALLPIAGEAAYPILTNPYVDATLTSGFGAHGLNHIINEGIDGWGDAAMTALEVAPLGRLAKPVWNAGKDAAAIGRRFILDVGDRYQGMKDAAAYKSTNGTLDARAIANMKWWENGNKPAGINRMGVSNDGSFGIYYPDNSEAGHYYSPTIEKGGEMTLSTHLGGDFPGEYSKDLLPMNKSEIAATINYLNGVPEHTYFGEVGKTKNYAEQYFNVKPSRIRAFKDAVRNKKEINEPYWNEEEHIQNFIDEEDPIEEAFYRHQYVANEPISTDAYKFILQRAAKDNKNFALRYDSSPMGLFNPQGFYEEEFYNSLQSLTPKEQVKAINEWMRSYHPKARFAYLENGKVMIPRPLLMLKGKK